MIMIIILGERAVSQRHYQCPHPRREPREGGGLPTIDCYYYYYYYYYYYHRHYYYISIITIGLYASLFAYVALLVYACVHLLTEAFLAALPNDDIEQGHIALHIYIYIYIYSIIYIYRERENERARDIHTYNTLCIYIERERYRYIHIHTYTYTHIYIYICKGHLVGYTLLIDAYAGKGAPHTTPC